MTGIATLHLSDLVNAKFTTPTTLKRFCRKVWARAIRQIHP